MRSANRDVWVVGVALIAAAIAAGASCSSVGDQCSPAQTECDGPTTIKRCSGSHDSIGARNTFQSEPCPNGQSCVSPSHGAAACALAADRVPECSPEQGKEGAEICWHGQPVTCRDGFAVANDPSTCGGACLEATPEYGVSCAFCKDSPDAVPDPACRPAVGAICADGAVHPCRCGYRLTARETCAAPKVCVSASAGNVAESFCALSAQPDPQCGPGVSEHCDRDGLVHCQSGYAVSRDACACEPNSGFAYCTYPDASGP